MVRDDWEYLPIAPAKKRAYPFQLRLCNDGNRIVSLPLYRQPHVRIDLEYEVPIDVLEQAVDYCGFPYILLLQTSGSIRHLRDFLRQRADKQASLQLSAILRNDEEQQFHHQVEEQVLSPEVLEPLTDNQPPPCPYQPSVTSCLLISSCIVALPLLLLVRRWRIK